MKSMLEKHYCFEYDDQHYHLFIMCIYYSMKKEKKKESNVYIAFSSDWYDSRVACVFSNELLAKEYCEKQNADDDYWDIYFYSEYNLICH